MIKLILLLLLLLPCSAKASEDNLCGPHSLAAICEKFGIETTIDALCAAVKYDTAFGTNMLNLYNGAKELGLNVKALSLTYKELKNEGYYIISQKDNHFEAIQKKYDGVVLLNDNKNSITMHEQDFISTWTGYAIEFSEGNPEKTSMNEEIVFNGPKLLLKMKEMDAGEKMEGDFIGYSFPLTNIGSDSLRIDKTRAGCSCVTYSLTNAVIAPQQTEYLYVSVNSIDDVGTFTQVLTAQTNDPLYKDITFTVTGYIVTELKAVPGEVIFENVFRNEKQKEEIVVISPNARSFSIGKIDCPSNMSVKIKKQSDEECVLELTLDAQQNPGTYVDSLVIQTKDKISKDIYVPVTWSVISDYEISPSEVVLIGNTALGRYTQDFRILSKDDIKHVTIACDDMDVTWDVKKVNDKYLLKTYLANKDDKVSSTGTTLLVTIDNQSINIPVKYLTIE